MMHAGYSSTAMMDAGRSSAAVGATCSPATSRRGFGSNTRDADKGRRSDRSDCSIRHGISFSYFLWVKLIIRLVMTQREENSGYDPKAFYVESLAAAPNTWWRRAGLTQSAS